MHLVVGPELGHELGPLPLGIPSIPSPMLESSMSSDALVGLSLQEAKTSNMLMPKVFVYVLKK